eukprot:TRINITY_DN12539_c1_g1_i1.p1 TRINITY_DN12539_c1_g1~~TRINITY_DN12539_c1_g1_i1.p1  ORF type:complete len:154 (-),score=29.96 TRINITY_DN12539_c1_g1_i1:90-551(-)
MEVSPGIVVRPLEIDDFDKGVMDILGQLTTVEGATKDMFERQVIEFQLNPNVYRIFVLEDAKKKKVIGAASLILESKLVHACGKVAHIEDVVVDSTYRGLNLGLKLINRLMEEARKEKCYKVLLDCSDKNVPFYERCGFKKKELQMVWYDAKL